VEYGFISKQDCTFQRATIKAIQELDLDIIIKFLIFVPSLPVLKFQAFLFIAKKVSTYALEKDCITNPSI